MWYRQFLIETSFPREYTQLTMKCKYISTVVDVLVLPVFRQSGWWNFMSIDSDYTRRHSLTANFLFLLLHNLSKYSSTMISEPWVQELCVHVCAGTGFWYIVLWVLTHCGFMIWPLLCREVSSKGMRTTLLCGYRINIEMAFRIML